MKKLKFLILFFLIGSTSIFAENRFTFRGEVIDYHSKTGIEGANVVFSMKRTQVNSAVTDANGKFEITLTEPFDAIFIVHVDYLGMIIREINLENRNQTEFCFQIPLFENPFLPYLIDHRRLTRTEQREYRDLQKIIAERLSANETIKYSRRGQYQFIRFSDLTDCEK